MSAPISKSHSSASGRDRTVICLNMAMVRRAPRRALHGSMRILSIMCFVLFNLCSNGLLIRKTMVYDGLQTSIP